MSFIQQFFTSRDNNANAETFVGQQGRLWWDPVTNQIYSSDGNTPGGIPLAGGGGGNGSPGGSNSQVQFNSSGTFGGSANLTFDRVSGTLTAVSFAGDGSALANITAANVVGEVSNATYASSAVNAINAETVTANSQPNITGVGILTSLSVSGNVDAAYFIGNGSQLTGIASSSGNRIFNGSSNVEIATADGNATITTAGTSTWTFDTVGNLNLPGGNIVQSTNRDLNIVVQDADNDDFALQTIVDDGAGTTLSRIRQRRGDIQLGTGLATGSPHYWQFDSGGTLRLAGDVWGNAGGSLTVKIPISDANSFISLQTRDNTDTLKSNINVTTTNVTISTNTAGNTWVFNNTGTLTAPGSVEIGTGNEGVQLRSNPTGTGFYTTITNITNGLSTVVVTLNDIEFIGGDQGSVTITGVVGETEANGFWGWEAVSPSAIQLYTDPTLSTPVDGTTWSAYVSGGLAVSSGYNELDIKGGRVSIISGSGQYWTFNPNGNLTLPSNTASINYANGAPYGGGGGASLPLANGTSNFNIATVNGNATITTNGTNTWTFDNTGVLTLPGEGVVRSNNDTVVIQSYDTANAAGYGMYVGTAGGLYFQQASNPVWLSIAPNASNVEIAAGVATGGAAGHNISITAGAADQTNYFTTAGGNINITGGLGAFNDGGGGGPGGSINISSGLSSDPAGVPGNITINSGINTWNFDYNGTLNLPEGTAYIGSAANTLTLHANDSEAIYISAISGGISAETNGNVTLISNVDGTTNYAWTFDNTGNLAAPGVITANTFVSNAYNVLTAGNLSITSQYGLGTTGTILEDNGDLEVYGSGGGGAIVGWTNNYSTLGNVATVNFNTVDSPGNILVRTGNRAATEYNWIFANNGTMSFPGNAINTGANPVTVWSNDSSKLLWRDSAGGAPGQPVQTTITAGNGSATITVSTGVLAVQSLKTWTFNTAGNVVFPDATVQTTAYPGTANTLSLIGNITGGNILTGGLITATGNITATANISGGNLLTAGIVSATGNITAGNIATAGLITATGNITVGNVNTGGRVSATGNILGGNLTVTGNAVITYTPATAIGTGLLISAANSVGGAGYGDVLRFTNASGGATNPNKTFRLNSVGTLEILNSAYANVVFSVTDAGFISIAQATGVANGIPTTNGIAMSTNSYIYDDGNYHLTSKTGAIWLNANDGSAVNINTQMPTGITGGGMNVQGAVKSYGAGASTAFISSGANVISGVALQLDSGTPGTAAQMAIRDTSTVSSTMYFDVSTGGSAHGSFQFRSSNAFSQLLALSNTTVTVNRQMLIGGGSQGAYVTITGTNSYNLNGPYGYLAGGGAGSVGGGGASGTVGWSLQCMGRIQVGEIDATSDERLKDIQGTIPLDRALQFVRAVDGILYTWKPGFGDEGVKSGFGAQSVHKAGFDHMVAPIPNDRVEGSTDADGFTSPDKAQLTLNYLEAIPYHHEVIKHLLDRVEQLEATIAKLTK